MYKRQVIFDKSIKLYIYLATIMQFVLGLLWLFKNLTVYTPDPISESYIQASKSLVVDDYMGILYAVFLKCFSWSKNGLGISISTLYIFQIFILGACIYAFVNTFFGKKLTRLDKVVIVIIGLFNPVSLQACCTVSPTALILSFILCVAMCIYSCSDSKRWVHVAICGFSSLSLVFLTRDIGYALAILYLILGLVMLKSKRDLALTYLGMSFITVCGLVASFHMFEPYFYHRGRRSFWALAVQRTLWNNIRTYNDEMMGWFGYDFSDELIKANQSPVALFTTFFYKLESYAPYKEAVYYYKYTVLRELSISTKLIFVSFMTDLGLYLAPMFGTLWVYLSGTPNTLISHALMSFTRECHPVFLIFFTFFAMFTIVLFVASIYKLIRNKEIKKYRFKIVALLLICIAVATYNTTAVLRGFDYRNSTVVIVGCNLIYLGYLLMDKEKT